jgi:glutamate dehydrogenase
VFIEMALKTADLESEMLETVCARVRERLPGEQARPCEVFIRQYYRWVPAEDLAERSPLDLYGAAVAHWNFIQQRAPGEAKVHVYNPEFEQDGWQSTHTVIEIVSDDMPFLVDSVTMELVRQGENLDLVIHPVIYVTRDATGHLTDVLETGSERNDAVAESIMHVEVAREPDAGQLERLQASIEHVLEDVRLAVEDWQPMLVAMRRLIDELAAAPLGIDAGELEEVRAFLAWTVENNFTFLGYREYDLVIDGDEAGLQARPDSGLGILRGQPGTPYTKLGPKAFALAQAHHLLVLTKANSRSTVHRPSYLDYIGVKRFDADGQVIGERRFLGLYTTSAYKDSPRDIPLLRGKVKSVLDRAGFLPDSHDAKGLIDILESYPRDSLFQIESDELFPIAMGILGLGERQRVRLFVRPDPLDRFVSCLVTIPRDRFNTQNRERVGKILIESFGGTHLDWTLQLSESLLVRVQYIVYTPGGIRPGYDVAEIEARLVRATRAWTDDLRSALLEEYGEEHGVQLFKRYENAFPPGYQDDWVARSAVVDIARLEEISRHHADEPAANDPIMSLYRPLEAGEGVIRCKLFRSGGVLLSDVMPTFEHMGAKVIDERPYEIKPKDAAPVWIYDFGLRGMADDLERVRELFQETFLGVWQGELEDDGLNGLVLQAALTGRQISIMRAVSRYLRQAGIPFSDRYMERTLVGHAGITTMIVKLFQARFDPGHHDQERADRLGVEIESAIDAVQSLDQDRILRSFLSVVRATLRTNYFCTDAAGKPRPFLSFKLEPSQLSLLPRPRPQFEIFVYSPRFEGVHLRGGKVARGGLRWSDRREDFRTEILGLMKAQMVKNALIVPVGSKGGFVLKRPPATAGREALLEEAITCYEMFLSGLLDLTENIVDKRVVPPNQVVRYDDDDPYLVVAADKGTATFSDIANSVSAEYGFWLGDAFASGGSHGYDHKQMGITARGAWESVKRHFRELGTDVQTTDFTVVGIGDMSGDVFGNGMLRSRRIKLVAAFNHAHIFLDPNSDPEVSFRERERLFALPRSGWGDYDESLISEGGGVYLRSEKSVPISTQVGQALSVHAEVLTPTELIRAILAAPVDLLWNGGIGTYVKASAETHADAGDKANDGVRVDGSDLRCRVVGEGGNLGFTQSGRIEYALAGGQINTDAIDNVAGVNTSDHEVNIKILLDALVADGELTVKQRNELLVEMTDAVADQVLYACYTQTQALSLALAQAAPMIDVHARLIRHLEQVAGLDRAIEFLPDEETISERKAAHQGLVSPEMAVVMAYCKIQLYAELLESDLPEDEYLGHDLERYFPPPLGPGPISSAAARPGGYASPVQFTARMRDHRLRREITSTVVANQLVDRAGTTFAFRLGEETGAPASILARGYAVAREVFEMRPFWAQVEALDNHVQASTQLSMLIEGRRLVERATRWLARTNPGSIDIELMIARYEPGAKLLAAALPAVLEGADHDIYDNRAADLAAAGVPSELAARTAMMPALLSVFDIVEVSSRTGRDPGAVMATYFRLASRLDLNWLRDRILELPRANRWQALARAALRDDLYSLLRALTDEVLEGSGSGADANGAIESWIARNQAAVDRSVEMIADIKASRTYDTTTLPVAMREVRNLIRASGQADADATAA